MVSRFCVILAMVAWGLSFVAAGSEGQAIPELHIPVKGRPELPEGVVRRFGSTTFRRSAGSSSTFPSAEPFFSPDGSTVYVPGLSELMAFDSKTGFVRFHYRYSTLKLKVSNAGTAGIRIDFSQGPLAGKFVLLEHGTGKELQRGDQALINGMPAHVTFADDRRALLVVLQGPGDPGPVPLGKSNSPEAILYDLEKQERIKTLGRGALSGNFVLSEDQRRLAFSCTEDMALHVCDTENGRLLQSLPLSLRRNYGEFGNPVWSRDGKTVYIWRFHEGEMQLVALDVKSGAVQILVRSGPRCVLRPPVVSPNGKYLAYQLSDNPREQNSSWRILRLKDLSEAHIVDVRPAGTLAAFSSNERSFWLAGITGLARFDMETGKLDPLSVDPFPVTHAMAFSPEAKRLYAVAGNRHVTWDVSSGREIKPRSGFDEYYTSRSGIRCIHISNDGRRTIWKGGSGDSHVHGLLDGHKVSAFYAANTRRYTEFDLTDNHQQIVHDAYSGELKLGDLWTGKTIRELLPEVRPREDFCIALAPDNHTMALFHRDYQIRSDKEEIEIELWDLDKGQQVGSVRQVGGNDMAMQFSQDSRELRVWHNHNLFVWRVADRSLMRRQVSRQPYRFFCTPNRHWMLVSSYLTGGIAQMDVVDIHTGKVARSWARPQGEPTAVAFSQDSSLLAVSSLCSPADLYRFYEPSPKAADLVKTPEDQLVDMLGGDDVSAAFDGMCELIRRGNGSLPALRTALIRDPISPEEISRLLKQLEDDSFEVRESATLKLSQSLFSSAPLLAKALSQSRSPETVARLKNILSKQYPSDVSRSARTSQRGVEALTAIGTTASRLLLKQLSQGCSEATTMHEARAVLSRTEKPQPTDK